MPTSKTCPDCRHTKKLSSFYLNKDFTEEYGHDATCSVCSTKMKTDKDGLKEYCRKNRRRFSEELWDFAKTYVEDKYKDDVDYNNLTQIEKEDFFTKRVISKYSSMQGNSQYYEYVADEDESTENNSLNTVGKLNESGDPIDGEKIYSQDWRGSYTKSQISWLDQYYADTLDDYTVKTRNHKDYCRKIAKASLNMDEASDDMLNNIVGAEKRYDKAKAAFDLFSNSAKLSEKTRGANDVAGLGSLAEVVATLERSGFLQKKIEFEDDDISKINKDLRHILSSMD